MIIKDLQNLSIIDDLYDLTESTFVTQNVPLYPYIVQRGEEMRIDLVSDSIFNTLEYADILLNINNIDNPLNIKEGSIIYYSDTNVMDALRTSQPTSDTIVTSKLSNTNKSTRVDRNRKDYIEKNYSLSPNILDTPTDQVRISGDNLIIGKGLF
jgi:hypothetical protein